MIRKFLTHDVAVAQQMLLNFWPHKAEFPGIFDPQDASQESPVSATENRKELQGEVAEQYWWNVTSEIRGA